MRFALVRNFLKLCIFNIFASLPPNFSCGDEISLKSPIKSHGILIFSEKFESFSQSSFLLGN